MSEALLRSLRASGPVSPAVQFRKLLEYGRERDWPFETAWRWAYERVRWPHDTTHRREWKKVLGESPDDPRKTPVQQREAWRSAYERRSQSPREQSAGMLVAA
jgi:hypothetical protein